MLTETNKAIVRRYLDLLRTTKRPGALDTYVDDAALTEHMQAMEVSFPGYYLEPLHIIAEGDLVCVRSIVHGTNKGPFMGHPATGKMVAFTLFIEYRVSKGKIVEHWMLADLPALLEQLGLMPSAVV